MRAMRRCGLQFKAPGASSGAASVFVPAALDDDQDGQLDDSAMDARPSGDWTGARNAILLGLLVGLAVIACVALLRDGIASNAPGLAPLIPPKAGPPPRFAARRANFPLTFSSELANGLAVALLGIAHLLILVAMPLALPAALSRFQILSVGRWLILAGVSGFFAVSLFAMLSVLSYIAAQRPSLPGRAYAMVLATIDLYVFLVSFFGIPGCLIAAAVHPKEPVRP